MRNPSGPILLVYVSRDGQTQRIAGRIAARISVDTETVRAINLDESMPSLSEIGNARLVVLIAAVRFGRHLKSGDRMLRRYCGLVQRPPLALASVNLTARKPGKTTPQHNPYLRRWIRRYGLSPVLATAFAGRLNYPDCKRWEREAIRFIMWMTGGETDPNARIEYTSWRAVDEFAEQIGTVARALTA